MSKIRIAVSGYGNLGRGVFAALKQNPDMEPVALFTRRDPASIHLRRAFPSFPFPRWRPGKTKWTF